MRIFVFFISVILLSLSQSKVKSERPNLDIDSHAVIDMNNSSMANYLESTVDDYQYFNECGFAIKAPCLLEDVSRQVSGEFFINYAGFTDKEDLNKMAFYQVIVNRLPIGYKDLSKQELGYFVDGLMRKSFEGFSNSRPIIFSYDEYPGYVMECTTNGYTQKGVVFWKGNFIICLTVISNDRLSEKFNKFTNSFKTIETQSVDEEFTQGTRKQPIKEIGYSLSVPCSLRKTEMQGYDIYYVGTINGESPQNAIIYKVMANRLPISYSEMNAYDRTTIRNNLITYLQSKENYKEWNAPLSVHMSYIADSTEQGFKIKEALLLTENMVIELIMLSKLDIESKFNVFINSISPIQ